MERMIERGQELRRRLHEADPDADLDSTGTEGTFTEETFLGAHKQHEEGEVPETSYSIRIDLRPLVNIQLADLEIPKLRLPSVHSVRVPIQPAPQLRLAGIVRPELRYRPITKYIRVPVAYVKESNLLEMRAVQLRVPHMENISVRPITLREIPLLEALRPVVLRMTVHRFVPPPIIESEVRVCELCIPRIRCVEVSDESEITDREVEEEGTQETAESVIGGATEESKAPVIFTLGEAVGQHDDRPICIIVPRFDELLVEDLKIVFDDSVVRVVALTCVELFRIRTGKKPSPWWISRASKDELRYHLRVGGSIIVIDDPEFKFLPRSGHTRAKDWDRVSKELLLDMLRELFSQEYGFVIFHVGNKKQADEFRKLLEEELGDQIPELISIETAIMPQKVKKELARMSWGFVDIEDAVDVENADIKKAKTFDELFESAKNRYYDKLNESLNDVELRHYVRVKGEIEDKALKILAVEALAKEMGAETREGIIEFLESGKIKTEGKVDIVADTGDEEIYVEIETLYGTGDPLDRLDGMLQKYVESNDVEKSRAKVIVVMLGLHMLMFLEQLLDLRKIYRRKHNLEVDFCTIDVERKRFVSLDEMLSRLKSIFQTLRSSAGDIRLC